MASTICVVLLVFVFLSIERIEAFVTSSPRAKNHFCNFDTLLLSASSSIAQNTIHSPIILYSSSTLGDDGNENANSNPAVQNPIEAELEQLQQQLTYIEALEERNKSQLESFIDEQDQWDSMEQEERQLLESKESIEKRMEILAEELVQMWMGAKAMDG